MIDGIIYDLLQKHYRFEEAKFSDLSKLNFYGVYIIYVDKQILYIGSAYVQTLEKRLNEYKGKDKNANSLLNGYLKEDPSKSHTDYMKEIWSQCSIFCIEHKDLEYHLIKIAKPRYNKKGKKILNAAETFA